MGLNEVENIVIFSFLILLVFPIFLFLFLYLDACNCMKLYGLNHHVNYPVGQVTKTVGKNNTETYQILKGLLF